MGSIGTATKTPATRTERLVNRITQEVQAWIDDSYLEDDDIEEIRDWHDLLENLDMEAKEAREYIIEALEGDYWDTIYNRSTSEKQTAARELTFDDDGTWEDENGNFLKYGDVMKLVKQELVKKNILRVAR